MWGCTMKGSGFTSKKKKNMKSGSLVVNMRILKWFEKWKSQIRILQWEVLVE